MPEICRFLGVVIKMFYREHEPAHFHAVYGEHRIVVYLETGVVEGHFPRRALGHVLEWYQLHRVELEEDWRWLRSASRSRGFLHWSSVMVIEVVDAAYRDGHRVWLKFSDGLEGEVDLGAELWGEVFEPLRDPAYFAAFRVDQTLTWPSGADFAPEFLHDLVRDINRTRV